MRKIDSAIVPPQAKEIERKLLGAIMLEKDAFDIASELLRPECFYVDAHQIIFSAMKTLSSKRMPIDEISVMQQLMEEKQLESIGGPFELTKLTGLVTSGTHVLAHSRKVFEKFLARELIKATNEINAAAYDETNDVFELMDMAENKISKIGLKNVPGEMVHISTVLVESVKKVEEWRNIEGSITGVPSGFKKLDTATRGWQPGDLIVIAARPSVGKTAFALNLADNAASTGKTVAVWSLEMKSVFLTLRMMAAKSNTHLYRLQTGNLDDTGIERLYREAVNPLSKLPIYFDDSSKVTFSSLARKARRMKRKGGLDLIIVDYLQLMKGENKSGNREQEVSSISRDLKELALELDIPIIALSQLNRTDGEKGVTWDFGPKSSSLRESGAIEQDADVICMLWQATDEEKQQDPSLENKRRVRVVKQRNGVLLTEDLDFKSDIQLFQSAPDENYTKPTAGNWRPVE